jgi:hypothetical protein
MPPAVAWKIGNDHAGWSQGMLETADATSFMQLVSSDIGGTTNQILYARELLPTTTITSGAVYNLVNVAAGNCVDVPSGSHTAGQGIADWLCDGATAQNFRIDALGDGTYRLTNTEGGLALTYGTQGAGTQIVQEPAGDGQRFSPQPRTDGAFNFLAVDVNLALDIPSGTDQPGAILQLYTPNGTAAQGFRLWRLE